MEIRRPGFCRVEVGTDKVLHMDMKIIGTLKQVIRKQCLLGMFKISQTEKHIAMAD